MSAKEMFEELGYEQDLNNKFYIGYIKRIPNTRTKDRIITFMKELKFFTFIDQDNRTHIELDELKAINQQCKELGWIE